MDKAKRMQTRRGQRKGTATTKQKANERHHEIAAKIAEVQAEGTLDRALVKAVAIDRQLLDMPASSEATIRRAKAKITPR